MHDSYAGLWARVLAFALDYLIIASYLVLVAAVGALVNLALPGLARMLFGSRVAGQTTGFALLESSAWQASWGKRRRGLRVVDARGGRLSRARAGAHGAQVRSLGAVAHTDLADSLRPGRVAGACHRRVHSGLAARRREYRQPGAAPIAPDAV
jgi:hypothetical protein